MPARDNHGPEGEDGRAVNGGKDRAHKVRAGPAIHLPLLRSARGPIRWQEPHQRQFPAREPARRQLQWRQRQGSPVCPGGPHRRQFPECYTGDRRAGADRFHPGDPDRSEFPKRENGNFGQFPVRGADEDGFHRHRRPEGAVRSTAWLRSWRRSAEIRRCDLGLLVLALLEIPGRYWRAPGDLPGTTRRPGQRARHHDAACPRQSPGGRPRGKTDPGRRSAAGVSAAAREAGRRRQVGRGSRQSGVRGHDRDRRAKLRHHQRQCLFDHWTRCHQLREGWRALRCPDRLWDLSTDRDPPAFKQRVAGGRLYFRRPFNVSIERPGAGGRQPGTHRERRDAQLAEPCSERVRLEQRDAGIGRRATDGIVQCDRPNGQHKCCVRRERGSFRRWGILGRGRRGQFPVLWGRCRWHLAVRELQPGGFERHGMAYHRFQ